MHRGPKGRGPARLAVAAGVTLAVGLLVVRGGGPGPSGGRTGNAPDEPVPARVAEVGDGPVPAGEAPSPPAISGASVCPSAGYLCADVAGSRTIPVRRWRTVGGPLVVHVPLPELESAARAATLQSAAAAGIRAWNGQPFPIRVDLRSGADAHFSVRWSRTLGGAIVGAARTSWSEAHGLRTLAIDLATRSPFAPDTPLDPERVRLTAAHEMGHALGLPHSDSERDVMYPSNRAASLSARDYRTMEALYALPDGAHIVP